MAITYAVGQRLTAELLQELADYTVNRPLVRLVQTSGQSILTSTTTPVVFGAGSTIRDTHGFHDEVTNNTRITPNVAGIYEARGAVYFNAFTTTNSFYASIGLNGNDVPARHQNNPAGVSNTRSYPVGPVQVECNGTTDYVELRAFQSSGATQTLSSAAPAHSFLELVFLRPS